MSNTYTMLRIHVVWSTKRREPVIAETIEPHLYKYIGGILRKRKHTLLCAGGTNDHIHLLIGLHPQQAISDLVRDVKSNSTIWMNESERSLRTFAWQGGYGAFSVSKSGESKVVEYTRNQKKRHARQSFQDEFRGLLDRHEVEYDEKYLWD